jgi:Cyclic nucleotide-binding domain/Bacterial SH3 domain
VVFAIDFEPISIGNSTIQLLLVLVLLTVIVGGVIVLGTQLAGRLVDRAWPADEPLDATEMLWGESGGYIQRHFKGLELDESKELASQFVEDKVRAGQFICEQGDQPDYFFVLKEGEAEVVQQLHEGGLVREVTIRRYGPGDSFGEIAILRRTTRTASVRAISDCVVLKLPAEDFVAGAALSAAQESVILGRVDDYLAADRLRTQVRAAPGPAPGFTATAVMAPPAPAPAPAPSAPAPAPSAPAWRATHVVPATGLLAWSRPDPSAPAATTLAAGVEVQVVDATGVWRKVVAANGWQGWVDGRTLVPR